MRTRTRISARDTRALRRILPGTRRPPAAARHSAHSGPWVDGLYRGTHGSLQYRLYVPAGSTGQPVALVVLLHGCRQTAEDFAIGTRMNALAETHTFLALYPMQSRSANRERCWNWFDRRHQQRGRGEPALVAGATRRVVRAYGVDPARVYVAGLSAGGAMALTLAATYPELYAAAGVHSGMPHAVANGVVSAWSTMRGMAGTPAQAPSVAVPLIVFHGDADRTVDPSNAGAIVEQWAATPDSQHLAELGASANGRAYTRSSHRSPDGALVEEWLVHGLGHAWSGGDPAGSFTDPSGPMASEEMLRFFAAHPRPAASKRLTLAK